MVRNHANSNPDDGNGGGLLIADIGPLDFDLECPACGYNLRGARGDPLRCTECGGWLPRSMIGLPVKEVAKRLSELSRAVVSAPVAVVVLGVLYLGVRSLGAQWFALLPLMSSLVFILPLVVTLARFAASARDWSWFRVAWRHQFHATLVILFPGILGLGGVVFTVRLLEAPVTPIRMVFVAATIVVALALIGVSAVAALRLYRHSRIELEVALRPYAERDVRRALLRARKARRIKSSRG